MQCKACGQDNHSEARFCIRCGNALVATVELPSPALALNYPSATSADTWQYTGFRIRFGAAIIDLLVIGIISFALAFPLAHLLEIGVLLLPLFLVWPYYWLLTGLKGQTVGKMLFHIRVINAQGSKPGLGRAFLREILGKLIFTIALLAVFGRLLPWIAWVSTVVLCVGVLWIAKDSRKQGWYDKIAGTFVINSRTIAK